MPRTTTALSTAAAGTARGPADPTIAGADPRDGRDPFEDRRGSGTAQPTVPELPPTPRRFCEATRRRAIDWPQTYTGITVDRPCPKGTRGRARTSRLERQFNSVLAGVLRFNISSVCVPGLSGEGGGV